MVSGSQLPVPFPRSLILPSVFISWKKSEKGEVMKNRENMGRVILAVQTLFNSRLKGFVSPKLVDFLLVLVLLCVCVCTGACVRVCVGHCLTILKT